MEPVLTAEASRQRALLVNRYAMPFAVMTVCLAVALGNPEGMTGKLSMGLLVFGAAFNVAANRYIEASSGASSKFLHVRMWVNLACNAAIVWMLGGYWTPAWLLLALTPIAAAIYSTVGETLFLSVAVSLILLARYAVRGSGTPLEWGEQACYAAFIVLGSLMVHGLRREGEVQAPR